MSRRELSHAEKLLILKESKNSIQNYIFERTVVVATHDNVEPLFHGSGTLLKLNEAYVVLTAAHVVMHSHYQNIQIVADRVPSNIRIAPEEKEFRGGDLPGGEDIAYMVLSEESSEKLRGKKFLTLSELDIFPQSLPTDLAILHGMPGELGSSEGGNIHRFGGLCYSVKFPDDYDWPKIKEGHPIQFEIPYAQKGEDFSGEDFSTPHPRGMSGGGLWRASFGGNTIWSPDRLKLVGVISEMSISRELVMANRVELLVRLLAERFPSAEDFLKQQEQGAGFKA